MSAEIVNLRRARKQRARTDRETEAAANRARFGATKAERTQVVDDRARRERALDGARVEGGDNENPSS